MVDTILSIIIAGDMVPTKLNEQLFIDGNISSLVSDSLLAIFQEADITSVNLECPLTVSDTPIDKNGPNLRALPETLKGINALNPSVVGLANNHIMDFGEEGLADTLKLLKQYNLPFVGVGSNLEEASQSLHIIEKKGFRIGFYACAEHEFSIATEHAPGANPFDALLTGDLINALKADKSLDALIVLYHGGKEYYQYPSPGLQEVCRHLIKKGADLVVCQHSHCIGAHEHYLSGDIVYGQGNFLFDMQHSLSKEGLLISYELEKGKQPALSFIPIKCKKDESGTIYLAKDKEREGILNRFHTRSEEILQPGFIENKYSEFARSALENYVMITSPFGKWFSRFDRYIFKGRLIRRLYSKRKLLALQNIVECEAHRELFVSSVNSLDYLS